MKIQRLLVVLTLVNLVLLIVTLAQMRPAAAQAVAPVLRGRALQIVDERNLPAVEELWESATRRYAIEHTRVDAFEGQADREPSKNRCLLVPVKIALADRLSGWFGLSVREVDVAATSSSSRCLDDRSASGACAFLVAVWWRS
jgi:hypothetical protein